MEIYRSRRGMRKFQPTFTGTSNYVYSWQVERTLDYKMLARSRITFLAMVI